MGLLTMFKGKKIIDAVETEVQTVTAFMEKDLKAIFTEAKEVALRSNERVANLKAELQKALIRSKNFHQAAIEAANAAAELPAWLTAASSRCAIDEKSSSPSK
jgi:hypothetical protein